MGAGDEAAADRPNTAGAGDKVFFAFDFNDKTLRPVVDGLVDRHRDGRHTAFEPSVAGGELGDLWGKVEARIRGADKVAALVDHANANVAFEYGFALGLGKPCYLGQSRSGAPEWIQGPPFGGLLRGAASKRSEIVDLIARDGQVVETTIAPGEGTLFLCPSDYVGEDLLESVEGFENDWKVPDVSGWSLAKLEDVLADCWRVVWVVLPFDPTVTGRHGRANAGHAAVAGFAKARGLELRVFKSTAAIEIVDVGVDARRFTTENDFLSRVAEMEKRDGPELRAAVIERLRGNGQGASVGSEAVIAPKVTDPIAAFRKWVPSEHATTVPFFGDTARALRDVFVGLNIRVAESHRFEARGDSDADEALRMKSGFAADRLSLDELLAIPANKRLGITRRWVLLGDPGSGKSTLCRRLACELAQDESRPLPILVSLARLADAGNTDDPFALVAKDATRSDATSRAELADALRERASDGGAWILLDGLDEVRESDAPRVKGLLRKLAEAYPDCPILVTSRRTGYGGAPDEAFVAADLLALDPRAQRQLLANWLGATEADLAWERLQNSARLADLARNPFLLTLLAELHREGAPLPATRGALYDQAIKLLLTRGFGVERTRMRSPESTEALLVPISLTLQEAGGESWPREAIHKALVAAAGASDELADMLRLDWPGGTGDFIEDVARNAGVIGPHDGATSDWRYLHRSLREFLAARALEAQADLDTDTLVKHLETEEGRARWGETVALLVGLLEREDPRRKGLIEAIVKRDHDLAHRTLPQLEGLDPEEALDLLDQVPAEERGDDAPWDGVDLAELLRNLRLDGADCDEVRRLVLEPVGPSMETRDLAHRYFALEKSGVGVDREAFFRRCGRWPSSSAPNPPTMVQIPPSGDATVSFLMGSPDGVGDDVERPQRQVTLSAYSMGATAVTEAEYAQFDTTKGAEHPNRPVVEVSWWEAWLYARWVGCELLSEAQWECAARAGTTERWSHGDDEAQLGEYAWFDGNSENRPHDVGTRKANTWGLLDMHGNVWEWCMDWHGDYDDAETENPPGPAAGAHRVLRGGSYWDDADFCRSAFRLGGWPWGRDDFVGFRVVLPSS
ncbi:SUMF1/EgtB/PvdO family nonheme iron enzyme [Engelhardtia mirabilis]|uniref:Serine/threonine-protein kinase pkn1 n=1 Tax=Engelhardtia mirabilis TaxID=2528011 RepID=A0A518BG23_9BACT|nr:Serine/threonine-protein kinase pkn1 [Planctomycetes bacterium Pla133]QDV00232.1 Serine/threonine-protein kinase pkn1 [Planctomycetes bacterium Pla86]